MEQGIKGRQILALQGPFSTEMNAAILRQYDIRHMVTKNSGRAGGCQEKLEAAKMLAADGIDARVINIHTIKPLDEELILATAKETGKVVTVEEHSVIGGLGSAVCDVLSAKAPTPVLKIGMQDVFGESGPAVKLLEKYGLNAEGIYNQIKNWF